MQVSIFRSLSAHKIKPSNLECQALNWRIALLRAGSSMSIKEGRAFVASSSRLNELACSVCIAILDKLRTATNVNANGPLLRFYRHDFVLERNASRDVMRVLIETSADLIRGDRRTTHPISPCSGKTINKVSGISGWLHPWRHRATD